MKETFMPQGWIYRSMIAAMALMLFYLVLTLTVSKCCYR